MTGLTADVPMHRFLLLDLEALLVVIVGMVQRLLLLRLLSMEGRNRFSDSAVSLLSLIVLLQGLLLQLKLL